MEKPIKLGDEEYLRICRYFDWKKDCFCRILGIEYNKDFVYVHTEEEPVVLFNAPALKGMLEQMMGLR